MQAFARIVLALAVAAAAFGQGAVAPFTVPQYFTNSGQPLAGGSLCSFLSGTSTPSVTYSNASLTTPNSQCVGLNSAGRPTSGGIFVDPALVYRFVLKDSTGVTIWTSDGISAAAGGTGGALWTQNGTTITNQVGTKVCISPTSCTTALAQLDVAGTSSGTARLIRVDDAASGPGLDLYGNGSRLGTLWGDSVGLKLAGADGLAQVAISTGNVTVQNGAASGGTALNVKESATQGSINPIQVLSSAGSTLAWVDPDGNGFFPGVNVSGTATNSLQAPNGGVFGQWLIASDSLFLIEEPQPALSATGQARVYADSTSHTLLVSQNGAAYTPLGSGGGGATTFDLIGTGANVTATMTVGTGATLTFTGTGVVNATKVHGTTTVDSTAADQALLTTAANVSTWADVPGCLDSGGNHLNYNTSTHAFSCGNTGGTVGSVSFSGITGSTNTAAAMVVGSGASLTVSGTGTINATQINAGSPPASGSVWVSNGTLQPVPATFTDIVAMFSGGAGCSGTNLLAANGTCQAGGGGGGTPGGVANSIQYNNGGGGFAGNSQLLWSASPAGVVAPLFNSTATGGSVGLQVNGGTFQVFGNGNVNAAASFNTATGYQVGGTTVISSARFINNVTGVSATGAISTTSTGQFNGAVNVNAGGSGWVSMGASEWQPVNANTVSLGDSSHDFATSYFRGLTVGAGGLGISGAGGIAVVGSPSLFLNSSMSFSGSTTIISPGGPTLNGTFTCPGGQHFAQLTISQGLITNYFCN